MVVLEIFAIVSAVDILINVVRFILRPRWYLPPLGGSTLSQLGILCVTTFAIITIIVSIGSIRSEVVDPSFDPVQVSRNKSALLE